MCFIVQERAEVQRAAVGCGAPCGLVQVRAGGQFHHALSLRHSQHQQELVTCCWDVWKVGSEPGAARSTSPAALPFLERFLSSLLK